MYLFYKRYATPHRVIFTGLDSYFAFLLGDRNVDIRCDMEIILIHAL